MNGFSLHINVISSYSFKTALTMMRTGHRCVQEDAIFNIYP